MRSCEFSTIAHIFRLIFLFLKKVAGASYHLLEDIKVKNYIVVSYQNRITQLNIFKTNYMSLKGYFRESFTYMPLKKLPVTHMP
jgi:hypothetical protein